MAAEIRSPLSSSAALSFPLRPIALMMCSVPLRIKSQKVPSDRGSSSFGCKMGPDLARSGGGLNRFSLGQDEMELISVDIDRGAQSVLASCPPQMEHPKHPTACSPMRKCCQCTLPYPRDRIESFPNPIFWDHSLV